MEMTRMETAMNTMNPDTTITRDETKQSTAAPRPADTIPEHPREDVVHRGEFRLLLWMGAFALTAVLGGMTFLYTAIMDLRVAMAEEHAELRVLMEQQHAQIRADLEGQIKESRDDLEAQIEESRGDLEVQIEGLKTGMQAEITGLRTEVINLRERVARIETHLGVKPVES